MKRWLAWFILPVLASVLIFLDRASGPHLLQDTDTAEILRVIRIEKDPWLWFQGDWPLRNHFYRPISTMTFEFDNWAFGDNTAGYGQTNALLVIFCVLALFWFVLEATRRPWLAGFSSALFGVWHLSGTQAGMISKIFWIPVVAGVIGLARSGKKNLTASLVSILIGIYLLADFGPVYSLHGRMVNWIPGRTASTMLVFVLIALAAYSRFDWQRAAGHQPKATPEDLPPTKGSETPPSAPLAGRWVWLALSLISFCFALGSYEQAIMVPAVIVALAVYWRTQHRRPDWIGLASFWVLLVVYLVVRAKIVPNETSGYQAQQFRWGPGALLDIGSYLLPSVSWFWSAWSALSVGLLMLLTPETWLSLLRGVGNLAVLGATAKDRDRWLIFAFLAISVLSFLPMAFLKMFEHYHAWPGAMRAVYMTALGALAFRLALSAVSLPSLQAPPRSDPAPDSLPHP